MNFMHHALVKASSWLEGWLGTISTLEVDGDESLQTVDFLGGPYDGLSRHVSASMVWSLPPTIEIPVCRSQFEILDGLAPDRSEPVTSEAIYQLDFDGPRWFYRFDRQVSVRESLQRFR